MELLSAGADHAVRRPGVDEVRLGREVPVRVDVVVPGGDHRRIPVLAREQRTDPAGDLGSARDGQRAALTEVALDVDDDQRA